MSESEERNQKCSECTNETKQKLNENQQKEKYIEDTPRDVYLKEAYIPPQNYGFPNYPAYPYHPEYYFPPIYHPSLEKNHLQPKIAHKNYSSKEIMLNPNIEYIDDKKRRMVSFCKRKRGIMKKCMEIVELTNCDLLLFLISESGRCYDYSTPNLSHTLNDIYYQITGNIKESSKSINNKDEVSTDENIEQ